jgi:hypothetical protein
MNTRTIIIALGLLGLSGCAAPVTTIDYYDVDAATLRRIKPIEVINATALSSGDFKQLGSVTGFHCRRAQGVGGYGADKDAAQQTAIDQIRLRAARKSASHITTPQCIVNESMDLVNNCWASIKCTSRAFSQQGN